MKLRVDNLSPETTADDVRAIFESFGLVYDVWLVAERSNARPSGFGLVEMDVDAGAIARGYLDGRTFGGRVITVIEARERVGGDAR